MKIREAIRLIEKDGWFLVRTRGKLDLRTESTTMRYTIILERGPKNYSAYAPDFPGCVAAADSEDETVALMREALALYIEDMRERGEQIPKPSEAREIEVAA